MSVVTGEENRRQLVYYISVTQDGFIAGSDGGFDFFIQNEDSIETLVARYPETIPTHLREELGIVGGNRVFDTVLMGRDTYEVGLPPVVGDFAPRVFDLTEQHAADGGVTIATYQALP